MTQTLKAHFDGRVIVPDEPVDLPVDQPLQLTVAADVRAGQPGSDKARRLRALEAITGTVCVPAPPLDALRREKLYDD